MCGLFLDLKSTERRGVKLGISGNVIGPRLLRQVAASRIFYFMFMLNCICCRVSSVHQEQNAF